MLQSLIGTTAFPAAYPNRGPLFMGLPKRVSGTKRKGAVSTNLAESARAARPGAFVSHLNLWIVRGRLLTMGSFLGAGLQIPGARAQPDGSSGPNSSPPTDLGVHEGLPRKEVIQPHLPVQLPCYDFVPVTNPTLSACLPEGLAQRFQALSASMT